MNGSPPIDTSFSWQDAYSTAPFIISGAWPARDWTNDDLIKNLPGSFPVRIGSRELEIGKPKYDNICEKREMSVRDFISWTSQSSSSSLPSIDKHWGYMDYIHLVEHDDLESFRSAFPWSSLLGRDYDDIQPTVWLGTAGAHSPLHYDTMGWNLHAQLRGSKQWLLVPPGGPTYNDRLDRQKELGATRTPYENTTVYSEFDALGDPSILSSIEGVRVLTLRPGDILFVPPLWWHCVCCIDDQSNPSALSFSCNIWLSERPDVINTIAEVATALKLDSEDAEMCDAMKESMQECMSWLKGEQHDETHPIVQSLIELADRGRKRYDDFLARYKDLAPPPTTTASELAKIDRSKMCLSFLPMRAAPVERERVRPWDILRCIETQY
ncbi:hypothetical protein PENTCL1PPCAC_1729 [Pristionchus entomophagus]|uniref:JmjC domain-containing protein n=1 Tax=Pristionchus entomophagus TaxID=358040 RepID=A0AAV5SHL3_9BILA|nr:hypothetical protein PENTCL1PPCAC_1729 [Pristionchus entomophagus]